VTAWIAAQPSDSLFLSVVSLGELRKGITMMAASKRKAELDVWFTKDVLRMFAGRILPITQAGAVRWGTLDGQCQLAGRPLNVPDGQIAATALEYGLRIVTRNTKDFDELGVNIINPWQI
jgi:predicted nucleic acid-binding protein